MRNKLTNCRFLLIFILFIIPISSISADSLPTVHLISPANSTNSGNLNQTFSCNITDSVNVSSLELYIWNSGGSRVRGGNYVNMSDGFSTYAIGSDQLSGVTTNGSDLWITDYSDHFVYHTNRTGRNMSDGFSTSAFGAGSPEGIATNNSDFWVVDHIDAFVYHVNRTGGNMSDGFSTLALGSNAPVGIAINVTSGTPTDFWVLDWGSNFVYHVNRTGGNMSGGFSTAAFGSTFPTSITANGSDFWITDSSDEFVYHVNKTGGNISDGFSTAAFGTANPFGITMSGSDFWILDATDLFSYHIASTSPIILSGTSNQTYWSYNFTNIGTYTWNCLGKNSAGNTSWSSEGNYTLIINDSIPPTINIISPSNNTNTTNTGININYSVSDNYAVGSCWYSNDSYSINNSLSNCANITWVTWSSGQHNVTVWANDTSNNVNSSSVSFAIYTAKPDISIIFPSNSTNWSSKSTNVNYTVSSNIGISSCWYSNDSAKHNTTLSNCANITGVNWLEGINNVTIWANDSVGNINSSSVAFLVDTTPPYFNNLQNQNLAIGQFLIYYVNASDSGVGLGSLAINWTDTFSINASTGILASASSLSAGSYYINVSVNDTLGNLNSSILLINVTGNATPVAVILISPANGAVWTSSSTVTFTYNANSSNSIVSCFLIVNNAVYDETGTVANGANNVFTEFVPNGNYNWRVNCADASNNEGNSLTSSLTVAHDPSGVINIGGGGGGGGGNQKTAANNTNSSSGSSSKNSAGNNITNISSGNGNSQNKNWISNAFTGIIVLISCIIAFVAFMTIRAINKSRKKNEFLSSLNPR